MLNRYPRAVVVDTSASPYAVLHPVAISDVTLRDPFWAPRIVANRERAIPTQYKSLVDSGRLDNFQRAAGKLDGPCTGYSFNDSDVYKWLEGAASDLSHEESADQLSKIIDQVIADIETGQETDGYINSYVSAGRKPQRWTSLWGWHELYCAGHLIQAAIAHHRATGSDSLLAIAVKFADYICEFFGPADAGKRPGADGHANIEMALVELYRETENRKYLDQALFFIDQRGKPISTIYDIITPDIVRDREYMQDAVPYRRLETVVGHAVRMVYLAIGATDVYLETGDTELKAAIDKQWENMVTRKMYITGGIGAIWKTEAFGADYELPNYAYAETCAAISVVMWSWRLLLASGDSRYVDILEKALYNGVLSGVSLDGETYFYENPLVAGENHRRTPWFSCACCPPNILRLLAQLPGYFYNVSDNAIWLNLYASNYANLALPDGRTVALSQETKYPWDGHVTVTVKTAGKYAINLRIPEWCTDGPSVAVNDEPATTCIPGTYHKIERHWHEDDTIRLTLPMPIRREYSDARVTDNVGRVAIVRGPLVYCIEQEDNPGKAIDNIVLSPSSPLTAEHRDDVLGGITAITADSLTAIPYYVWANRSPGDMEVWIREL